jgi:hypothetical protein
LLYLLDTIDLLKIYNKFVLLTNLYICKTVSSLSWKGYTKVTTCKEVLLFTINLGFNYFD